MHIRQSIYQYKVMAFIELVFPAVLLRGIEQGEPNKFIKKSIQYNC